MVQTSKVKKTFNAMGVQLSAESLNMIRDDFSRHIKKMVIRCRDGNVRRLTPETYHIALGNLGEYLRNGEFLK
jgi:hypothetical protein